MGSPRPPLCVWGAPPAHRLRFFLSSPTLTSPFPSPPLPLLLPAAERSVADAAAGRLPPDADEDLASLLGDKEALLGSLAQSHEGRVAKILRREGELKAREERRCGGAVTAARRAELARNRQRIEEIKGIAASGRKRVEGALSRADTWGEHGHHGHHGHHGGDHGHGGAHAQHPAHGHGHFSVMHKA
jgi:hypothetical protein